MPLQKSAGWALAAATAACALLLGLRMLVLDNGTYRWLIWPNLALAWIPLAASWLACRTLAGGRKPGAATFAWAAVWLAFYPNASYIATDLIHLEWASGKSTLYYDLSLNMLAAMLGWTLGAISLWGLQLEVERRLGKGTGAVFAGTAIALGAIGVYLGRVLRWNSWDLVSRPHRIVRDAWTAARDPEALAFIGSFALFTGAMYVVFYTLANSRAKGES